jgi:hypothetical protein
MITSPDLLKKLEDVRSLTNTYSTYKATMERLGTEPLPRNIFHQRTRRIFRSRFFKIGNQTCTYLREEDYNYINADNAPKKSKSLPFDPSKLDYHSASYKKYLAWSTDKGFKPISPSVYRKRLSTHVQGRPIFPILSDIDLSRIHIITKPWQKIENVDDLMGHISEWADVANSQRLAIKIPAITNAASKEQEKSADELADPKIGELLEKYDKHIGEISSGRGFVVSIPKRTGGYLRFFYRPPKTLSRDEIRDTIVRAATRALSNAKGWKSGHEFAINLAAHNALKTMGRRSERTISLDRPAITEEPDGDTLKDILPARNRQPVDIHAEAELLWKMKRINRNHLASWLLNRIGLTHREIAMIQDVTFQNVSLSIKKIRKNLRKTKIGREYIKMIRRTIASY